jgi:hypothetical protein
MERCLNTQFIRVETGCESEQGGQGEAWRFRIQPVLRKIIKDEGEALVYRGRAPAQV